MDDFCAVLRRVVDWVSCQRVAAVAFADAELVGPIRTPRLPLVELLLVLSGSLRFRAGDHCVNLPPGGVALFNAHFGNGDDPAGKGYRYACVSLDVSKATELRDLGCRPWLLTQRTGSPSQLLPLYHEVVRHYHWPAKHLPQVQLKAAVLALLAGVYAAAMPARAGAGGDDAGHVSRLIEFIHAHQSDPVVSLESLARAVHVSQDHLGRLFRRKLGVSPLQYLTQLRISRASSLLSRTDLSIKQIARAVGYADQCYFARVFRRQTGRAPSSMRGRRKG